MRGRWMRAWVAAAAVLALCGTAEARKKAPPPDVKCGTPEWAPFREAVAAYCKTQSTATPTKKRPAKRTEKWRRGKEVACEVTGFLTHCRNPREDPENDGSSVVEVAPIKQADSAKKAFTYQLSAMGERNWEVRFLKTNRAWKVTDVRYCEGTDC